MAKEWPTTVVAPKVFHDFFVIMLCPRRGRRCHHSNWTPVELFHSRRKTAVVCVKGNQATTARAQDTIFLHAIPGQPPYC